MPLRPLLTLPFLLLASTGTAHSAPALWQVSDEDSSIWLFGSVHLLRAETKWRSPTLDKVLSKAERVYFETDLSIEAQMAVMPMSFELGFNRDGRLLSDIIGAELTARVREAAGRYAIPMANLLTMKPWMAATTLSTGPLLESGYEAAHGVETVLAAELTEDRLGYLETPEQQLNFLAGGSLNEQIAMLEGTLDTLDVMQSDIDEMVRAWSEGQPEQLGEIFTAQMGSYDQGMVERLIDMRNADWVEQIDAMLGRNESALLVVGAAHLAGDASVVRLLEARGFGGERLQ